MTAPDPMELARQAAERFAQLTDGVPHHAALALGSGLLPALDAFGDTVVDVPVTDLPGFPPPTAPPSSSIWRSGVSTSACIAPGIGSIAYEPANGSTVSVTSVS